MAQNDPFELRITRLTLNHAQDAMGFAARIHNAQSTSMCGRMGSLNPGYILPKARGGIHRRRPGQPLVQVAPERHERDQQRQAGKDGDKPEK